jgi:hypothetical protein
MILSILLIRSVQLQFQIPTGFYREGEDSRRRKVNPYFIPKQNKFAMDHIHKFKM